MNFSLIVADPPWKTGDLLNMSSVKRGAASNYSTMSTEELCQLQVKELANPNGCILALWVLGSMLSDGMRVMESWGFQQKQTYCWIKTRKEPLDKLSDFVSSIIDCNIKHIAPYDETEETEPSIKNIKSLASKTINEYKNKLSELLTMGMGRTFRQCHEICLIGINNTKIYKSIVNKSQRSVCFAPNLGHSIKPEVFQDNLEKLFGDNADINKLELFGRRARKGWTVIGNEATETKNEDISVSIDDLIGRVSLEDGR